MSVRLIIRRIKPPVEDYVFESEDILQNWSIGTVKLKLISKFIKHADFNRLRIIYQGRLLQNSHNINDIIQTSDCRETLVLYMVNLDEIYNVEENSNILSEIKEFPSDLMECLNSVDKDTIYSDQAVQTEQFEEIMSNKKYQPDLNVDEFYTNYINLIQRANSDVNAYSDLTNEHSKLFSFSSSLPNSYIQSTIIRCSNNATSFYAMRHQNQNQANNQQEAQTEGNNEAVMGEQNARRQIRAVNSFWDLIMRYVRQYDPMTNFLFMLKLSILLILLYMYEGLSRLLTLLLLVVAVYMAQHTGIAERWLGVRRRVRDVVQTAPNSNDQSANTEDNQQNRLFATIRWLLNFLLSLVFSIVPIEENLIIDG